MTQRELIAFLKENLRIEIERAYDHFQVGIGVTLYLCGEVISNSEFFED